ncbi:MAG: phage portal protein, partial [Phycisphaerales bacterium]
PDRPELAPDNNPLAQLVARPNEHQSWPEMQQQSTVYLNVDGNTYFVLVRDNPKALPDAIYCLRPDRVYIVATRDETGRYGVGYIYVPEGKSIFRAADRIERRRMIEEGRAQMMHPDDVMHVKLPNPLDPLEGMGYGLSPIAPMARSVDVDNSVTKFLKEFFDRGMMPNIAFTFKEPLDPGTIARIRERAKEIFGGFDRWIEPLILDSDGDVKQVSQTFDEMGFGPIDERTESRIMGPFGVPPILCGTRVGLTRSSYGKAYYEARTAFWEDTYMPEMQLYEQEFHNYLTVNGTFLKYDLSEVPALKEMRNQRRAQIFDAFKAGAATRNEYRLALGLDELPSMVGNVFLMPFNLMEVPADRAVRTEVIEGEAEEVPALPPGEEGPALPAGEEEEAKAPPKALPRRKRGFSLEAKQRIWKAFDASLTANKRPFGRAAEAAFRNDLEVILDIINRNKQAVNWQVIDEAVREYLLGEAGDNWREAFLPVMAASIQAQGEIWAAELGMAFDVENLMAQQWFQDYTLVFAQEINQTTLDALDVMFVQAQAEGWSIPDMEGHLETMFQQWMFGDLTSEDFDWYDERMPLWRRELIARTETMRSSNGGIFHLFESWNVPMKEWLSAFSPTTRPEHAEAGTRYMEGGNPGPIPMGQAFEVGGERMMFPGDPSASVGNVANCKCTVLPYNPMWGEL